MKKNCLFVMASALVAGSATSGPSHPALPDKGLPNYDIRGDEANSVGADAETLAAARPLLANGRSRVLSLIPGLHVEDNLFGTVPEIVDITGSTAALTEPSTETHESIMRRFVVENSALYGLTAAQARQLQTVADSSHCVFVILFA
jgi:hypothetical protein